VVQRFLFQRIMSKGFRAYNLDGSTSQFDLLEYSGIRQSGLPVYQQTDYNVDGQLDGQPKKVLLVGVISFFDTVDANTDWWQNPDLEIRDTLLTIPITETSVRIY
jgi:hypothetical protein